MKIIIVSILIGLFFFITKRLMEQKTVCLVSVSVSVTCVVSILLIGFVLIFYIKKKIQELTDDIDKMFLDENFLVRFKNELRKQQENIKE